MATHTNSSAAAEQDQHSQSKARSKSNVALLAGTRGQGRAPEAPPTARSACTKLNILRTVSCLEAGGECNVIPVSRVESQTAGHRHNLVWPQRT